MKKRKLLNSNLESEEPYAICNSTSRKSGL